MQCEVVVGLLLFVFRGTTGRESEAASGRIARFQDGGFRAAFPEGLQLGDLDFAADLNFLSLLLGFAKILGHFAEY